MKNKLLFLAIATMCIQVSLNAQLGTKINTQKLNLRYVKLPLQQLPDQIKSYQVDVARIQSPYGNMLGSRVNMNDLKLPGYKNATSTGDLLIRLEFIESLRPAGLSLEKTEHEEKDKEGNVKERYSTYEYIIKFLQPVYRIKLSTPSGEVIADKQFGGAELSTNFDSYDVSNYDGFRSEGALRSAWERNEKGFYTKLEVENSEVKEGIAFLSDFAMQNATETLKFKAAITSKKYTYPELAEASTAMRQAFKYWSEERIEQTNRLIRPAYDQAIAELDKAIKIWNTLLLEYDPKSRKARINKKVGQALHHNLVLAYCLKEDFNKAEEHIAAAKAVKISDGMGALRRFVSAQRERYDANAWRNEQFAGH